MSAVTVAVSWGQDIARISHSVIVPGGKIPCPNHLFVAGCFHEFFSTDALSLPTSWDRSEADVMETAPLGGDTGIKQSNNDIRARVGLGYESAAGRIVPGES